MATSESDARMEFVGALGEEFMERFRRGERPALREYTEKYPEYAEDIEELFPALVMMEDLAPHDRESLGLPADKKGGAAPALQQLGDYRVIREVGRGGMGIVYEAEQVSLGRHVALKVLPQQSMLDKKHKRRFEREAKAAARLHHTNIVPVFGVGEDDGLHYYVMQFIQGLGLDEVIDELRHLKMRPRSPQSKSGVAAGGSGDVSAIRVARSLMTGQFEQTVVTTDDSDGRDPDVAATAAQSRLEVHQSGAGALEISLGATTPSDSSSASLSDSVNLSGPNPLSGQSDGSGSVSSRMRRKQSFWTSVAGIGQQVASALQYAHEQGVTHRDIKPSNLLLDLRGTVWVTDFGLAKANDQQDITHTGDILGTLRYMPPEAFEGKSGPAGDLYSLGLTLYEMLAQRPAFEERDRHKLIKLVTTGEPQRIEKLNPEIPPDLTTIIHKAVDRDPSHRYSSAREMADDLQRFLDDEPIKARRISLAERFARWSRRNRGLAASLAVVCVLLLIINIAGPVMLWRMSILHKRAENEAAKNKLLAEVQSQLAEEKTELAAKFGDLANANGKLAEANGALAKANLARAEEIQTLLTTESAARAEAERQKELSRRAVYSATMLTAERLLEDSERSGQLTKLLAGLRPKAGETDLRGWEWYYASSQTRESRLTLRIHEKHVHDIAYSPDGARAASTGHHGIAQIWDAQTGALIHSLSNGPDIIWLNVDWTPDGRHVLTSESITICVWNAESGELEQTLEGHTLQGSRHALAVAPDGSHVAALGSESTIRVWNLETGKITATFQSPESVNGLAWSPESERIVTVGDGPIRIWDAAAGQMLQSLGDQDLKTASVVWFDDQRLATCENDDNSHLVRIWDIEKGTLVRTLEGHSSDVSDIAWSPEQGLLATCSTGGSIRIWDPDAESDDGTQTQIYHVRDSRLQFLTFRPGSRELAAGGWDNNAIQVWNFSPDEDGAFDGYVAEAIAFSSDHLHLASIGDDRIIRIWDRQSRSEVNSLDASEVHSGELLSLDWGEGDALVVSSSDGNVTVWNAADGELLHQFIGRGQPVNAVCWSPDGERIAAAGNDQVVVIWSLATGEQSLALTGHAAGVTSLDWSPDGSRLISGDSTGSLRLWNAKNGRLVGTFGHAEEDVRTVRFSPDGNQIVTAGSEAVVQGVFSEVSPVSGGIIRLWDADAHLELQQFRGHAAVVTSLDWSRDGTRVLSAAEDGTVRLWDVASGQELLLLESDAHSLFTCARFSPDGMQLAAAGNGASIELWDSFRGHARDLSPELLPLLDERISAQSVPDDLILRGRLLAQLGRWDQAAEDFQRAIALSPVDPPDWFLSPWWVIGPYPEELDAEAPPERQVDPVQPVLPADESSLDADMHWLPVVNNSDDIGLDLGRLFHQLDNVSGYAQLRVFSAVEQDVGVLFGADDAIRLWFNGEHVHARHRARIAQRDDEGVNVTLQPGWNTLLAKVSNRTGDHGLFLRLTDDPAELARVLERSGLWDEALSQWTRATERTPENAQLHLDRARAALFAGDKTAVDEALSAASRHSPAPADAWQWMARVYESANRLTEAADAAAHAVESLEGQVALHPDDAALRNEFVSAKTDLVLARLRQGGQLWKDAQLTDAVDVWRTAGIELQSLRETYPDEGLEMARVSEANRQAVRFFTEHGLWEDAAEQLGWLSNGRFDLDMNLQSGAVFRLFAGDVDAYRQACRRALPLAAGTNNPTVADRIGKMCLLIPDAVDDLEPALQLADFAVTGTEQHAFYHYFQLVKGLAEYRRGNNHAVIEWLESKRREHELVNLNASEDLLVAMAYHRLGESSLAQHWLDQARSRIAQVSRLELATSPDQMRCELLRREAETLITGSPPADDSALRLERALGFARMGRQDEAAEELAAAGDADAADARGMTIRGYVLARNNDPAAVDALDVAEQRLLQRPVTSDGTSVDLWMTVADGFAAINRHDRAAQAWQRAASLQALLVSGAEQPDADDLHRLDVLYERLAETLESSQQSQRALAATAEPELLQAALQISDSRRPKPAVETDAVQTDAMAALNQLLGRTAEADPAHDPVGMRLSARLLRRRGRMAYQAGQVESGANDLQQARLRLEEVLSAQAENSDCAGELADVLRQSFDAWSVPAPDSAISSGGAMLTVQSDGSILASGPNPESDTYTLVVTPQQPFVTGFRLELLPDPSLPRGNPGRAPENGNCVLSEFEVLVEKPGGTNQTEVAWRSAISNHGTPASEHYERKEIHARNALDGDRTTYWEVWPKTRTAVSAIFVPVDRIETPAGTRLVIRLISNTPGRHFKHNLGRFRLALTGAATPTLEEPAASPWMRLAIAYADLGEPASAAPYFARMLDTTDDLDGFGGLADGLKNRDAAFDELAKLRPDDPLLLIMRGRRQAATGELRAADTFARARSALEARLTAVPDDLFTADVLAEVVIESQRRWAVLQPTDMTTSAGTELTLRDDGSILASQEPRVNDSYIVTGKTSAGRIAAIRLEALPFSKSSRVGPGWGGDNFHLTEFRARWQRPGREDVPLEFGTPSASHTRPDSTNPNDGPAATIDGDQQTLWDIWPQRGKRNWLLLPLRQPIDVDPSDRIAVELDFLDPRWPKAKLGCFRLSVADKFTSFDAQTQSTALLEITDPRQQLGAAYAAIGDSTQAVAWFSRALDSTSDFAQRRNLVSRLDELQSDLDEFLARYPDDPLLWASLSRRQTAAGDLQMAAESYAKARSLAEERFARSPTDESIAGFLAELLSPDDGEWTVLKPVRLSSESGTTLTLQDDGSILPSGANPSAEVYTVVADLPVADIKALRLDVLPDPSIRNGATGRSSQGSFTLTEVTAEVADSQDQPTALELTSAIASFERSDFMKSSSLIDGRHDNGIFWNTWPHSALPATVMFAIAPAAIREENARLMIRLDCRHKKYTGYNLGRFRLSVTDNPAAATLSASQMFANSWAQLGAAYAATGDSTRAAELFARALDDTPKFTDRLALVEQIDKLGLDADQLTASRPNDPVVKYLQLRRRFRESTAAADDEQLVAEFFQLLETTPDIDRRSLLDIPEFRSVTDQERFEQLLEQQLDSLTVRQQVWTKMPMPQSGHWSRSRDGLRELIPGARARGFRPTFLATSGSSFVTIWMEDGRDHQLELALTREEFGKRLGTLPDDMQLVSVEEYADGGATLYAALWVRQQTPAPWELHERLSESETMELAAAMQDRGFRPTYVNAARDGRLTTVWVQDDGQSELLLGLTHHDLKDLQRERANDGLPVCIDSHFDGTRRRYCVIIDNSVQGVEWKFSLLEQSREVQRVFELHEQSGWKAIATTDSPVERVFRVETSPVGAIFPADRNMIVAPHVPFDSYQSFCLEAWVSGWNGRLIQQGVNGDPENSVFLTYGPDASYTYSGWETGEGENHQVLLRHSADSGWRHLAMTFDGTRQRFFIDGQLQAERPAPAPGPLLETRELSIGGGSGLLGPVRISKVARYTADFTPTEAPAPDADTVLFYDLTLTDDGRVQDRSGNGRHGTIVDRSDR